MQLLSSDKQACLSFAWYLITISCVGSIRVTNSTVLLFEQVDMYK